MVDHIGRRSVRQGRMQGFGAREGGGGCEVILITRFYPPPPPPQRSREFNSTVLWDTLLHPPPSLPSPIVTRIAHVRSREFLIT